MRRERSRSLLLLSGMNIELPITTIERKVQEMLETEPARRYGSVREVKEDEVGRRAA